MERKDLIKCCVASLNFIHFAEDEREEMEIQKSFMSPSNKNLTNLLAKNGFDTFVEFTEFISYTVLGYENPPCYSDKGIRNPVRDFFSDENKSSGFFIDALTILRSQDWIRWEFKETKSSGYRKRPQY